MNLQQVSESGQSAFVHFVMSGIMLGFVKFIYQLIVGNKPTNLVMGAGVEPAMPFIGHLTMHL